MRDVHSPVPPVAAPLVPIGTHCVAWSGAWSPPLHLNQSAVAIAQRFDDVATSFEVATSLFSDHLPADMAADQVATVVARVADTLDSYGILDRSDGYGLAAAAEMLPRDPNA